MIWKYFGANLEHVDQRTLVLVNPHGRGTKGKSLGDSSGSPNGMMSCLGYRLHSSSAACGSVAPNHFLWYVTRQKKKNPLSRTTGLVAEELIYYQTSSLWKINPIRVGQLRVSGYNKWFKTISDGQADTLKRTEKDGNNRPNLFKTLTMQRAFSYINNAVRHQARGNIKKQFNISNRAPIDSGRPAARPHMCRARHACINVPVLSD